MIIIFTISTLLLLIRLFEATRESNWRYTLRQAQGIEILEFGRQRFVKPKPESGRDVEIWELDFNNDLYEKTGEKDFNGLMLVPEVYADYCVYENVLGEKEPRDMRIPMVLHSSLSYLDDSLVNMSTTWDGPISMAIFVDEFSSDSDFHQITAHIAHLRAKIRPENSIFIHLFFRRVDNDECPMFFVDVDLKASIPRPNAPIDPSGYPINVARNIARRFAPKHDFFLVADMDQEYSLDAEKRLRSIATKRNLSKSRELLVIRRFEYRWNASSPRTVSDVRTRYNKDVFFFHQKYFASAHGIPKLKEWMERGDKSTKVEEVLYASHYWEPMFVAPSDIPYHDETLRYQHMNHLALCWDLCVLGYRFMIVDGVFNTHKGVKELKKTGYYKWPSKDLETLAKKAAKAHRERLMQEHPNEMKRCLGPKKNTTNVTKAQTTRK